MGTLKTFLDSKKISENQLVLVSGRIESYDPASRKLIVARAARRRSKDIATIKDFSKKYSDANIAKPATSGRGLNALSLKSALADKPVARKVRSKIFRAVNHILTAKKEAAVDMKALFEGTTAKVGKKAKEEKAAAKKK